MARPIGPKRTPKALVVDDLPVNRLILGTILHKLGFEVLEAENGLQCIDVYNQERMHLVCVFLDLQMPVADGWEATKGIRELESRTADSEQIRVPVVVCTASCLDELVEDGQTVVQRALSLGADGAVRKPLTTFAVQRILDEYAPRWRCSAGKEVTVSTVLPMAPLSSATAASGPSPLHGAIAQSCEAQAHAQPHPLRAQYHRSYHHHPPPPPQQQLQQQCGGHHKQPCGGSQRQPCAAPLTPVLETSAARAPCSGERRTVTGAVRPGRDYPSREPGKEDGGAADSLPPPKRPSFDVGARAGPSPGLPLSYALREQH